MPGNSSQAHAPLALSLLSRGDGNHLNSYVARSARTLTPQINREDGSGAAGDTREKPFYAPLSLLDVLAESLMTSRYDLENTSETTSDAVPEPLLTNTLM